MKNILLVILLLLTACSEHRELTQDEIQHQRAMEMQRLQGNQQIAIERTANQGYEGSYNSPQHVIHHDSSGSLT